MYTQAGFFVSLVIYFCLLTLYKFCSFNGKRDLIFSDGKHKIHVSTRQSLVHDWRVPSFAVARHEKTVFWNAWKWPPKSIEAFPQNIKLCTRKTLELMFRQHSAALLRRCTNTAYDFCNRLLQHYRHVEHCSTRYGKSSQHLIIPLLSIWFINKRALERVLETSSLSSCAVDDANI